MANLLTTDYQSSTSVSAIHSSMNEHSCHRDGRFIKS